MCQDNNVCCSVEGLAFLGEGQLILPVPPAALSVDGREYILALLYATSLPDNALCTHAYGVRRKRQLPTGRRLRSSPHSWVQLSINQLISEDAKKLMLSDT